MDRVILHCDCNSFFASVETVLNPSYSTVPMAVCGSVEDRHGIVLAKNELAKAYGIKTADTVYSAKRLCPELVIAKPHYDKYIEYSHRVNAIYAEYTDLIEPFGIDESWLDVTASGRVFGSGYEIAENIRKRVHQDLGITVSIGVSFNKIFAKLGSDYKKPNAITVINRENYKQIAFPLPVESLLYVGEKSAEALSSLGIRTIGDLANAPSALLINKFGKYGEMISCYARGDDNSPVAPRIEDSKSVGNGFTFKHDLTTIEEISAGIYFLSEEIGRRLREKELLATVVSINIKDHFLRSVSRQKQLDIETDIGKEIADAAILLSQDIWSAGKHVRTITVTAQGLIKRGSSASQISLFSIEEDMKKRERSRRNEETIDEIRRKFGKTSIVRGIGLNNDMGYYDPKTGK